MLTFYLPVFHISPPHNSPSQYYVALSIWRMAPCDDSGPASQKRLKYYFMNGVVNLKIGTVCLTMLYCLKLLILSNHDLINFGNMITWFMISKQNFTEQEVVVYIAVRHYCIVWINIIVRCGHRGICLHKVNWVSVITGINACSWPYPMEEAG